MAHVPAQAAVFVECPNDVNIMVLQKMPELASLAPTQRSYDMPYYRKREFFDLFKSLCAYVPRDGTQRASVQQTRHSGSSEPGLHLDSSMLSLAKSFLGATLAICKIVFCRRERL